MSPIAVLFLLVFFFSSRRRHTRFKCDWSSDVCSSDLPCFPGSGVDQLPRLVIWLPAPAAATSFPGALPSRLSCLVVLSDSTAQSIPRRRRSEERRVGKECRVGWSTGEDRDEGML